MSKNQKSQSHIGNESWEISDLNSALIQVQKLELENQIMSERMKPLIYENEELRTKLSDQKRLRSLVKTLFSSIDEIIVLHINKLNDRDMVSIDEIDLKKMTSKKSDELLLDIHILDIDTFYDKKNGVAIKNRKIYGVILHTYLFFKRIAHSFVKLLWKFAKLIKRIF